MGTADRSERIGSEALRSIFEHSLDGIMFTAPNGEILAANPAACAILRLTEDEICARGRAGLADTTDERWLAGIRSRKETGRFNGELRMVRGDGSVFTTEVSSAVFADPQGNDRATVIFRDVTDRAALAEERERLAAEREVVDELERVARDLHDTVIQRLFALGMSLQAVYHDARVERVADRIATTVEGLDDVIRDIRSTIFTLQRRGVEPMGLRSEIQLLADDAAERLGFQPSVGFEGPVDAIVDADAAHHVRSVVREALSNIVKHAGASHVQIVVAADDELVVTVADNGKGLGPRLAGSGHGLRNMEARARNAGGRFRASPNSPSGTVIEWAVPLR